MMFDRLVPMALCMFVAVFVALAIHTPNAPIEQAGLPVLCGIGSGLFVAFLYFFNRLK